MRRWIVTALGKDRPGIVAGVTQVLYKLGCNLEDSAMTRLEGEFAVMLIFSGSAKVTELVLERAFGALRKKGLAVHIKPLKISETVKPAKRGKLCVISVYGADRPGIVYHISKALAARKINITNVETHQSKHPSLYLMLLEVEVPKRFATATLETWLRSLGKKLKVEVTVRSGEADVL